MAIKSGPCLYATRVCVCMVDSASSLSPMHNRCLAAHGLRRRRLRACTDIIRITLTQLYARRCCLGGYGIQIHVYTTYCLLGRRGLRLGTWYVGIQPSNSKNTMFIAVYNVQYTIYLTLSQQFYYVHIAFRSLPSERLGTMSRRCGSIAKREVLRRSVYRQ